MQAQAVLENIRAEKLTEQKVSEELFKKARRFIRKSIRLLAQTVEPPVFK